MWILTLLVSLALTGCATSRYTSFAPLQATLEPVAGGGQLLVLRNTTDQDLHHYKGSVYIWSDHNARLQPRNTHVAYMSGPCLHSGQEIRFLSPSLRGQAAFVMSISAVELVGHCDEGRFRQAWRNTEANELQSLGPAPIGSVEAPHTATFSDGNYTWRLGAVKVDGTNVPSSVVGVRALTNGVAK